MANPDLDPDLQRQRIEGLTKRVGDLEQKNEQLAQTVAELEDWAQKLVMALQDQNYDDPPLYLTKADIDEG